MDCNNYSANNVLLCGMEKLVSCGFEIAIRIACHFVCNRQEKLAMK